MKPAIESLEPRCLLSGSIVGSEATAAASYNLTALGTGDWAHWGRGGVYGNFDHDASGGSQISNVTKLGSGSYGGYTYSARDVSWTNGTPTASNSGDDGYIWANNALGAGYSFTVPATTSTQTLSIYLGGASSGGTLTATLSDGSATPYSVTVSGSSNYQDLVTLAYNAASAGQTLTLSYTKTQTIGAASGSVDLMAAWLTAPSTAGPTITTNPQSQTIATGNPATFTAAATGTPAPSVQWEISTNGGASFSPISGATTSAYTIASVTLGETGYEYDAYFSNSVGTATTSPATLTVVQSAAPVIISNPQSQTVLEDTPVIFSAVATGTPAPTVRWLLNSGTGFTLIAGATATTLSLGDATLAESGNEYEASFVNSAGATTSTFATLTVTPPQSPPLIVISPQSQTADVGGLVSFNAAAMGTPTPIAQWEILYPGATSFTTLPGATTPLTNPSVAATDNGDEFEAVFANASGTVTTAPVTLTVVSTPTKPIVTFVSQPLSVVAGTNVQLIAAAADPAPSEQWLLSTNGGGTFSPISGATSSSEIVYGPTLSQSGDEYEAVFANSLGTVTTSPVTLSVTSAAAAPSVATQPQSQALLAGSSATFTTAASGSPTPTVQWETSADGGINYAPIPGATSPVLQLSSVTPAYSGYLFKAIYTNTAGTATSAPATLTVIQPGAPTVTTNPISQSASIGAYVTLTAAATGTPAPAVQWQFSSNGGASFFPLTGATATTYTIGPVDVQLSGYEYEAIFTNSVGTATTAIATLTVTSASAGALSGTESTAAASYNLTTLGTGDWAHWGTGGNASSFVHDATGGSQISNVTKVGSGGYGGWTYSARDVIWSNGTPTASDSGDDGYIYANNALGAGYSFTVPASTTSRTVYIYLGGAGAGGTLNATLSDGSASPYSVSISGSSNFQDIVAITYNAASAGQTLTLTYTKTQTIGAASGSVDLIAAWLGGAPAATGPTITTNPQSQSVTAGTVVSFTAAASGNPAPTVQWELSTNGGASFVPITSATLTTLSIGTVAAIENGSEYEAVFTNSVGTATTAPATLTVASAPTITTNPQSTSVTTGTTTVLFSAAASGNPTPTVQWDVSTNGGLSYTPISGATATSLVVYSVSYGQNGYQYEAVFTNSVGTATTAPATLTVNPSDTAPQVTSNPEGETVVAGTDVKFSATVAGYPVPAVQWYYSANGGATYTSITGATADTVDLGPVTTAENAYEYQAIFSNSSGTASTFPVSLYVTPSTSAGSITGSYSTAAASYNLTTLGTTDWAHWGTGGNASSFVHDASGGSQISNVTKLGSGSYGGYTYSARDVIWTNGTPTSSDTGDDGYIWANNAIGAGYSFTVPASTTTHTLYVYLGGASSGGTLTASLSDNSAAAYTATISSSSNYQDVVAITFHAASAGQTLTISWVKSQTIGAASGSVDLIAAWLQ